MSVKDFVFPRQMSNTIVLASALSAGILIYEGANNLTEKEYGRAANSFLLATFVGMFGSKARRVEVLTEFNKSLRSQNHQLAHMVLEYQLREAFESAFASSPNESDAEQEIVIEGEGLIREVAEPSAGEPGLNMR